MREGAVAAEARWQAAWPERGPAPAGDRPTEQQGGAVVPRPETQPDPHVPQFALRPRADCHSQGTSPGWQAAGMVLGRPGVALAGQVGSWGRQACPPLPSSLGVALSPCLISSSLREEFLGHSHCCPIPWTPHDNKVEGWVGRRGVGSRRGSSLYCLPLPLTTPLLSHAGHPNMGGSMQRMNPPRGMGPMGPGPQVMACVHPFP